MKKILFTIVSLLVTVNMFAGSSIKVKEGDASFMKNSGTVAVVINWDNAQWNKEMPVREHWTEEYDTYVSEGYAKFVEGFNEKSKSLKVADSAEGATYVMNIEVTNVDRFWSAMSVVPGNKHKMWGTVTVTEKATGKVVCVYSLNEFKGGRDFSILDSFKEMMKNLGKELAEQK